MPVITPKSVEWARLHKQISGMGNHPIALIKKTDVKKGLSLYSKRAGVVSKKSKTRKEVSKALKYEIQKLVSSEDIKPSEVKAKSRNVPAKIFINAEVDFNYLTW
jgi:hypothetical protein